MLMTLDMMTVAQVKDLTDLAKHGADSYGLASLGIFAVIAIIAVITICGVVLWRYVFMPFMDVNAKIAASNAQATRSIENVAITCKSAAEIITGGVDSLESHRESLVSVTSQLRSMLEGAARDGVRELSREPRRESARDGIGDDTDAGTEGDRSGSDEREGDDGPSRRRPRR